MRKKSYKGKLKRVLPALLAAVLWIEGTFGAVYAAEPAMGQEQTVSMEENTASDEKAETDSEENGTAEGENAESEKTETPVKEEGGENEESGENGETEEPEEGKLSDTEEEETSDVTEGEDTDSALKEEDAPDTISENALEQEEESAEDPAYNGECALGEPPLMTGYGEVGKVYTFSDDGDMSNEADVERQTPSTVQIIERYKSYPWSLDVANSYSDNPSTKNPYKAGHLSNDSLVNALNLVNFIRYVAGIPADVELNDEYTKMAQAGALLNRVNGKLEHNPTQKPSGFPDDLYETGKLGCSKSNIAMGYGNIAKSLLNGWMYDGDSSNIDRIGHRRWILNPSMTQTGFGAVGVYSNMYAVDSKGSGISDFVAWPARNMPIELMNGSGTPWTVSLGSDYGKANFQKVTVTLQDLSKNKTYTFSGTKAEGVFKVNTDSYGMANCIIFRPNNITYSKTSQFRVTITGLTKKDGTDAEPLSYNVDFFSLSDKPAEVDTVTVSKDRLHLLKDEEGKRKETLFATIKPSNAADKRLDWKSVDESVATVDENGNVEAVGVGETTVSVTAANKKQDVCVVKVSDYALFSEDGSFTLDEETKIGSLSFDLTIETESKKLTLLDGGSLADSGDQIQWKSENESVASVDDKGNVTPLSVGETVIWANVENGLAVLECEVTVEKSGVSDLQIRGWEENCTLGLRKNAEGDVIGDTGQLRVYFDQADTKWKQVKWKSDTPSAVMLLQGDAEEAEILGEVGETAVIVKAVGSGSAKISATVVDGSGNPVEQGKGQAVCTVTVREQAEAPKITPADQPVALTNTQLTLGEVALPDNWSWKEPETALTQFAGGKSKKLAAVYQPDAAENELPSERLLEVHFLTVNSLFLGMRKEGEEEELSSLQSGQTAECYVNYFDEETIQKFEGPESALKENRAYKGYKENIEENIRWTSSNLKVAEVESVGNGVKLTAKEAGTTTLKVQLKLGKKTFSASRKITVIKEAGTLTVTAVEGFQPVSDAESVPDSTQKAEKTYIGLLCGFKREKANEVNSKIMLTLPGAVKVTAKSNNAKVVSVKTSAVEGDGFTVSLIVKAAGTARITLTGNDEGKTSQEITLVVEDAEPGLGEETVTVNTLQDTGTVVTVYSAKSSSGEDYAVTDVKMGTDEKSKLFNLSKLSSAEPEEKAPAGTVRYILEAKSGTKNGTYKVKLLATAAGTTYELPLTVKVVETKPKCKVKQVDKLNLFEKEAYSLLEIDTDGVEIVTETGKPGVVLKGKGAANYYVELKDGNWCLRPRENVAVNSIKKGELSITLRGYTEPITVPFTAKVEKKAPKITWESSKAIFYPNAGMTSVWVGVRNPENIPWEEVSATLTAGGKNNYDSTVEVDRENGGFILRGSNLNQAETVRATISLQADSWTEPLSCKLTIQVSKGQPGIALTSKTLQLNADAAYKGYDAATATVKWKDGGTLLVDSSDKSFRVSVYCDTKDAKAAALVQNSQVVFSVTRGPEEQTYQKYQIGVRLNNKDVASGTYKFIVQAAQNGKVWKTPLTLKVVNTAPDKAVKISAKGSIDVLNREGSFMTLTPSLKAVNGSFVIPRSEDKEQDKKVKLRGRDAHLFTAKWDAAGTKIELRAKQGETLVTKYQYSVTPVIELENVNGESEEIQTPAVKFKVKQGSAKITASPKTALMYSGVYNSVEIDMNAVLKGADAPEIENVTLVGNTDAFTYEYNKEGKGTLTMIRTGRAVKGKTYSLQFQVRLSEQADNVKPITVGYKVKVK